MKNCIILEIRPWSEQVVFAYIDTTNGEEGEARLFTEEEAKIELEFRKVVSPMFKFQIVTLAL